MSPSFTCWARLVTMFPCPQDQVGGQVWGASVDFCLDLCFAFQHDQPHLPPLSCCSGTYLALIISDVALYQILCCERWDLFHFFYLENQWSYQSKISGCFFFLFWHNLCLVKLCSILDHFCNSLVKLPFPPNHIPELCTRSAQQPQCCSSSSALLPTWPQITPVRVTFLISFHVLGQKIVTFLLITNYIHWWDLIPLWLSCISCLHCLLCQSPLHMQVISSYIYIYISLYLYL